MKLASMLKGLVAMIEVEGQPVRDRGAPARITVAGVPVFVRYENGVQRVLGVRIRDARK